MPVQMTNDEIIRSYTESRNKQKQIRILADLNVVTPAEIRKVLAEAGVTGVKMPVRLPSTKKAAVSGELSAQAFWERIEAILSALPEELSEDAVACTQNLLQTLFADYLHWRLHKRGRDGA